MANPVYDWTPPLRQRLRYRWWRFLRLIPRVRQLEDELEVERMRLAACGVAALGWTDQLRDLKSEHRSATLSDVLRLRNRYETLLHATGGTEPASPTETKERLNGHS